MDKVENDLRNWFKKEILPALHRSDPYKCGMCDDKDEQIDGFRWAAEIDKDNLERANSAIDNLTRKLTEVECEKDRIEGIEKFLKEGEVFVVYLPKIKKFAIMVEDGDCGFDPGCHGDNIEEVIKLYRKKAE